MLQTAGVEIAEFPMGLRLELLKALSDPNIAYLLMTIGTIGIMAELYNPGAILPGIVGAISLILAFYSLQSLPVNYAGVLLLLLGHRVLHPGSHGDELRPAGHRRHHLDVPWFADADQDRCGVSSNFLGASSCRSSHSPRILTFSWSEWA